MNIDNYLKWQQELDEKVYIEDRFIIFSIDGNEYEILLDRVATPEMLAGWVFHLTEKSWIDIDLLHHFMKLVSEYFGYELHA